MLKFFDFYLSKVKQTNSIVLRRCLACDNEPQARRLRTNHFHQYVFFVCRRKMLLLQAFGRWLKTFFLLNGKIFVILQLVLRAKLKAFCFEALCRLVSENLRNFQLEQGSVMVHVLRGLFAASSL